MLGSPGTRPEVPGRVVAETRVLLLKVPACTDIRVSVEGSYFKALPTPLYSEQKRPATWDVGTAR